MTGTFAGVLPVREVDGRQIGDGKRGPVVKRLQEAYVREVNAVCPVYTSDAADDRLCVDLGGRPNIKKKNIKKVTTRLIQSINK